MMLPGGTQARLRDGVIVVETVLTWAPELALPGEAFYTLATGYGHIHPAGWP